jgi:hypothetical protein
MGTASDIGRLTAKQKTSQVQYLQWNQASAPERTLQVTQRVKTADTPLRYRTVLPGALQLSAEIHANFCTRWKFPQ